MKHSKKLISVLAFSGWTQDRLADLLGVTNGTVNSWINGKSDPKGAHAEKIDYIYGEIVEPFVCELEERADRVAEKLLKEQITKLPDNNVCKVEVK